MPIDRLWPRGVTKAIAAIVCGPRNVTPTRGRVGDIFIVRHLRIEAPTLLTDPWIDGNGYVFQCADVQPVATLKGVFSDHRIHCAIIGQWAVGNVQTLVGFDTSSRLILSGGE
jgi:hypothetical protein